MPGYGDSYGAGPDAQPALDNLERRKDPIMSLDTTDPNYADNFTRTWYNGLNEKQQERQSAAWKRNMEQGVALVNDQAKQKRISEFLPTYKSGLDKKRYAEDNEYKQRFDETTQAMRTMQLARDSYKRYNAAVGDPGNAIHPNYANLDASINRIEQGHDRILQQRLMDAPKIINDDDGLHDIKNTNAGNYTPTFKNPIDARIAYEIDRANNAHDNDFTSVLPNLRNQLAQARARYNYLRDNVADEQALKLQDRRIQVIEKMIPFYRGREARFNNTLRRKLTTIGANLGFVQALNNLPTHLGYRPVSETLANTDRERLFHATYGGNETAATFGNVGSASLDMALNFALNPMYWGVGALTRGAGMVAAKAAKGINTGAKIIPGVTKAEAGLAAAAKAHPKITGALGWLGQAGGMSTAYAIADRAVNSLTDGASAFIQNGLSSATIKNQAEARTAEALEKARNTLKASGYTDEEIAQRFNTPKAVELIAAHIAEDNGGNGDVRATVRAVLEARKLPESEIDEIMADRDAVDAIAVQYNLTPQNTTGGIASNYSEPLKVNLAQGAVNYQVKQLGEKASEEVKNMATPDVDPSTEPWFGTRAVVRSAAGLHQGKQVAQDMIRQQARAFLNTHSGVSGATNNSAVTQQDGGVAETYMRALAPVEQVNLIAPVIEEELANKSTNELMELFRSNAGKFIQLQQGQAAGPASADSKQSIPESMIPGASMAAQKAIQGRVANKLYDQLMASAKTPEEKQQLMLTLGSVVSGGVNNESGKVQDWHAYTPNMDRLMELQGLTEPQAGTAGSSGSTTVQSASPQELVKKLTAAGLSEDRAKQAAEYIRSGATTVVWNHIKQHPLDIHKAAALYLKTIGADTLAGYAKNPAVFYGALATLVAGGGLLLKNLFTDDEEEDEDEEERPRRRRRMADDEYDEFNYAQYLAQE